MTKVFSIIFDKRLEVRTASYKAKVETCFIPKHPNLIRAKDETESFRGNPQICLGSYVAFGDGNTREMRITSDLNDNENLQGKLIQQVLNAIEAQKNKSGIHEWQTYQNK